MHWNYAILNIFLHFLAEWMFSISHCLHLKSSIGESSIIEHLGCNSEKLRTFSVQSKQQYNYACFNRQYFFYCEYEYDEWNIQTNDRQTVRRWRPNVIHRKHVTNTSEKEGGIIPPVLKVGGTDPPYPPRLRRLCMGYERLLAAWLYWVLCTTVNVQQITHTVIILVNVTVIMPTEQRIAKRRITKCASVRAAELRHSQRLRSVRTSLQIFLKYHTQNNYDY